MDPSFEFQFWAEYRKAQEAAVAGLEGRARVCARRAEAILLRDYLNRRNELDPKMNTMDLINHIQKGSTSRELSMILSHFSEKVDKEHHLPSNTDLIASLFIIAQILEIKLNPQEE